MYNFHTIQSTWTEISHTSYFNSIIMHVCSVFGTHLGTCCVTLMFHLAQVKNASYARNVGSTAEQCCDKTCQGFAACPAHLQASKSFFFCIFNVDSRSGVRFIIWGSQIVRTYFGWQAYLLDGFLAFSLGSHAAQMSRWHLR